MSSDTAQPTGSANTPAYSKHPFLLPVEQLKQELRTNLDTGLNAAEVQSLHKRYGPNRLSDDEGVKWYRLLFKQISNAMILVR
jgi:magnesium-transporting ATPase (P-type)